MKTIYYNANVYTGQLPLQQAFAVQDGRFVAVGTNAELLALQSDELVDLCGAFVCAGFNDSHMHLLNYGQTLSIAPLARHTDSMQSMLDCLAETPVGRGGWILGRGWNQDLFQDEKRMPTRWDLDKVSTQYPVCATRACGHALAVNSKALQFLGITGSTPPVEGGCIVMEDGEPNGIFLDNAMELVQSAIPPPTKEQLKQMLRSACKALNSYGVTSCHSDDYCVFLNLPWETINEAYRELEQAGELTVRVYQQANFSDVEHLKAFVEQGNHTGTGSEQYRIGPLKLLGDGALGARTAFLSQPYADEPSTKGISVFTAEQFDRLIGYANRQNMQVAVHCIGDTCLDMVLDSIEKALRENPRTDHRHGIVHCQITRAEQLERIARLGLHVYAQSIFLDYDLHIVQQRVGEELAKTSYSWHTLQQLGATVSNGSDCPVELPWVMGGIQCAVTRCDLAGEGPYLPDQAFTVQQALDSFTSAGAYASFEERHKGVIAPGMLADFVVLAENPFAVQPKQLAKIPVLATYLEGRSVYKR